MSNNARLLAAHDEQLRTDAETPSAVKVARHGALRLVTFANGRGFVTYQHLGAADADTVRRLVLEVLVHFKEATAPRRDPGRSPVSDGLAERPDSPIPSGHA